MSARPPLRTAEAGTAQGAAAAPRDPLPGYEARGALRGRRALVFGGLADRGPGRAVAAALAKEGAAVALADATGLVGLPPGAQPLPRQPLGDDPVLLAAGAVSALGAWSFPIHCDPASVSDGRAVVAYTALEFGHVDLLVVYGAAPGAARLHHTRAYGGLGAAMGARAATPRPPRARGLGGALRAVREARTFLSEGASAILLGERSAPEGAGGGPGVRAAVRSLAGSLRERRVRVNCLIPRIADSDAAIAAAVAELAVEDGRTGEVVGVAGAAPPP